MYLNAPSLNISLKRKKKNLSPDIITTFYIYGLQCGLSNFILFSKHIHLCYESTLLVKAKILTKDTKRPAISGKSGSVLC